MPEITDVIRTNLGIRNKGGAYFVSNMRKSPGNEGILADYKMAKLVEKTSSATSEWLTRITQWCQRKYVESGAATGTATIFGKVPTGSLYAADIAGSNFYKIHHLATGAASRGILVDLGKEILYVNKQYVGRTATSYLTATVAAAANTINVNDASSFPASGEVFIKDGTGANSEVCSYSGKSVNQLTGVSRGLYNTTDRTHTGNLEVISFDDDWLDLGSEDTDSRHPIDRVEDYIFVGHGNLLIGWKEIDGSDKATKLTLPAGYDIVDFSYLPSIGVMLIAANKEQEGILFVYFPGLSTFEREIPTGENIQKLHKNYVALASGIYTTNGYTLEPFALLPDDEGEIRSSDLDVWDMKIKGEFLLVSTSSTQFDRNRPGLWILDIKSKDWFFVLNSGFQSYGVNMGAIIVTLAGGSASRIWTSWQEDGSATGKIDSLTTDMPSRGNYYQVIYAPTTAKVLKLKQIKLNLDAKIKAFLNNKTYHFDVIVRYYAFNKPFLQTSQIKAASSAANQLVIFDTTGVPNVGDRIEVIEKRLAAGADIAGAPRNITAVVAATGKYTLTLDDDLPATPNSNNVNEYVVIHALTKIKKVTFSNTTSLDEKKFRLLPDAQPEFKRLMIEIEFRDAGDLFTSPQLNFIEVTSVVTER